MFVNVVKFAHPIKAYASILIMLFKFRVVKLFAPKNAYLEICLIVTFDTLDGIV